MNGHPLMGKSYTGQVIVYDTDIFSTGGAWGLYFKAKIANTGPLALVCRTVHPISVGGAVDAEIPAADSFNQDPCTVIRTGDWVKITAQRAGEEAIMEVRRKDSGSDEKAPPWGNGQSSRAAHASKGWRASDLRLGDYESLRGVRPPLRPTGFSVYASDISFVCAKLHPPNIRNTRYGWPAGPYPTGTLTLQEMPNFAWRTSNCQKFCPIA